MRLLEIPNQEEEIRILERASYEVQCRQSIITFMINNNMNENENYKRYWNEYILYTKAYNKLKLDFENNIKKYTGTDFSGKWEVDFSTKEIKLL